MNHVMSNSKQINMKQIMTDSKEQVIQRSGSKKK